MKTIELTKAEFWSLIIALVFSLIINLYAIAAYKQSVKNEHTLNKTIDKLMKEKLAK